MMPSAKSVFFEAPKNHISVDVKHKLIRKYEVTGAEVHDSNIFENLLACNTSRDVYADSAYRSEKKDQVVAK